MNRILKYYKRIISFAFAFSLLFGIALSSKAQEEVPRATFTNHQPIETTLRFTKNVEGADDMDLSNVVFNFSIKFIRGGVDQNPRDHLYKVFKGETQMFLWTKDGDGEDQLIEAAEQPDSDDPQKQYVKTDYRAKPDGSFTLKAGQTAVFEDLVIADQYEIHEFDLPDNFTQSYPGMTDSTTPGVVTGTIEPIGDKSYMTNRYVYSDDMVITKRLDLPTGYFAPDEEEFTFVISLAGEPCNERLYILTDLATDKEEEAYTDENGVFKLKGNQTATFKDVETNIDYSVEETNTGSWYPIGTKRHAGSTSNLMFIDFLNGRASFYVRKQLYNKDLTPTTPGNPEKAPTADEKEDVIKFLFVLAHKDGSSFEGAEYYIYNDMTGKVVDDIIRKTNSKGEFYLKPGQTAMFIDIPVGTGYQVKEVADPEYVQIAPTESEGYTNKTVKARADEIHTFMNKIIDLTASISVTKHVAYDGEAPEADEKFTFILYKREKDNDDKFIDTPMSNMQYTITKGTDIYSYKTDSEGKFTLSDNVTAVFPILPVDTVYVVKEVQIPSGYTVDMVEQSGHLTFQNTINFKFTNKYIPPEFRKIMVEDDGTYIGSTDSVSLGDKVNYQVEILIPQWDTSSPSGKELAILEISDIMSQGLSYNNDLNIEITAANGADPAGDIVGGKKDKGSLGNPYAWDYNLVSINNTTGETVWSDNEHGFALEFDSEWLMKNSGSRIRLTYTATVNDKALMGSNEEEKNKNKNVIKVLYNKDLDDPADLTEDSDYAEVYTYGIMIDKFAKGSVVNPYLLLEGAEFGIYLDAECTKPARDPATLTTDKDGLALFSGLAEGTYYLKEIRSPEGYKLLINPIKIEIIADRDSKNELTGEYKVKVNDITINATKGEHIIQYDPKGGITTVAVRNQKDFSLPETGAFDTYWVLMAIAIGVMIVFIRISMKKNKKE
ncbi:MAG: SpaA isopeptide-forming pilin-related protein [Suipraeoptans sp.]